MSEPLDHELKFGRAFHHLKKLEEAVKPWVNGERHTTRCEVNGKDRTYFATAEQPSRDLISPIIGDVLHNLRSGLDNLAFALAASYTHPLPDDFEESSEFPIFGDRAKSGATGAGHGKFHDASKAGVPNRGSGLIKIRGWHPDAQTAVEGLQPYNRGNSFENDPLWVLHELDRIDKHRTLHVGVAGIASGSYFGPGDVNLAGMQGGQVRVGGGPIETDTPYAWVTGATLLPIDPSKDVYMDIGLTLQVAFAPSTPCVENQPICKTLLDLHMHVAGTVVPALQEWL
jgi:hypothetical protein